MIAAGQNSGVDFVRLASAMVKTLLSLLIAFTAARAVAQNPPTAAGTPVPRSPSEDAWAKVRELKTGVELRIMKKGSMQPVLAKMDEADDERLVIILKDEQVAISKDQIDRIDYRPVKSTGKMVKETRSETKDDSAAQLAKAGPPARSTGPTISSSTTYSSQSKPDFETIYRRPLGAPKK
jgi:hypothetical protein